MLVTLCVTEITSWGVLYYAFPVLSGRISADTGWSATALMAAFSVGLVVSGLLGIAVGRWLDRHGPRWLMSAGSLLAAFSLVGIALAPSLTVFVLAWVVAGVAMSAVLYAPAFAALTRWYGDQRVRALTALTLVAGLASTVFAPLTAALEAELGWRHTYLVLAALLAVVTVPAHLVGLRLPWPPSATTPVHSVRPLAVIRSRPFLSLVLALVLASCASHAVLINLVPFLGERGIGPGTAAVVLGVGGVGQVLGRLGYPRLFDRLGVRVRTTVVLGGVAVTTALLAALTSLATVAVAAVLAGMVRGVFTLLQATAVTDRWGVRALRRAQRDPCGTVDVDDRGRTVRRCGAGRAARRLHPHAVDDGRPRVGRDRPRVGHSPSDRLGDDGVAGCADLAGDRRRGRGAGGHGARRVHAAAGHGRHRALGREHYGALSGILAAPLTLTTAVAPFVGAALAARLGGYTPMLWTMVALALAATGLGLATVPRQTHPERRSCCSVTCCGQARAPTRSLSSRSGVPSLVLVSRSMSSCTRPSMWSLSGRIPSRSQFAGSGSGQVR